MASRVLTVYCFFTTLWILTKSALAFGPQNFTSPDLPKIIFSPSHVGYGDLVTKGRGSEMGNLMDQILHCENSENAGSLSDQQESLVSEEIDLLKALLKLASGDLSIVHKDAGDLKDLYDNRDLFYSGKDRYQKKIFSNNKEAWLSLPPKNLKQAEKFLYLQNKILPSENVKAVLMLDILEHKEGTAFENLENLFKRSYFLINSEYIEQTRLLIQRILRKDSREYQNYISQNAAEPFYLLGSLAEQIGKKVERAHRQMLKGNDRLQYQEFLNFHQGRIENILKANSLLHAMAQDQLYAEGLVSSLSCERPGIQMECQGVTRQQSDQSATTLVNSNFHWEYFQAFRKFSISESENGYLIKTPLRFKVASDISESEALALITEWQNWSMEFYNQGLSFEGVPVRFEFDFKLTKENSEESINIRRCWNASRSSSSCDLPTQPDAKNLTSDLKRDALLEEVGHHMGLFDEYRMHYYHFNLLGAEDSFMVAPEDYRIYPHHIKMILAPHLTCQ